jgi:hypothetical protein
MQLRRKHGLGELWNTALLLIGVLVDVTNGMGG